MFAKHRALLDANHANGDHYAITRANISVFIPKSEWKGGGGGEPSKKYALRDFYFFFFFPPDSSAIPRATFLRTRVIAIVTMRGRGREYASDVRPNDFGK